MLQIMTKKIEKKSPRSQQSQSLSALWLCFLMFVIGYLAASWFDINQCISWVSQHLSGHQVVEKDLSGKADKVTAPTEQHPKLEFYTLLTNDAGVHGSPSAPMATSPEPSTLSMQYKNAPETQNPVASSSAPSAPMELAVTAPVTLATPAAPEPVKKIPKAVNVTPALPRPVYTVPKVVQAPPMEKMYGQYVIQVGSFRSLTEANRMRDKLRQKGYAATITPVRQQATSWYRVTLGPFSSLGQAQQTQYSLSHREHIVGMIRRN
jgi:cell division protein FtsN